MNLTTKQKETLKNLIYLISVPTLIILSIIIETNF